MNENYAERVQRVLDDLADADRTLAGAIVRERMARERYQAAASPAGEGDEFARLRNELTEEEIRKEQAITHYTAALSASNLLSALLKTMAVH